MKIKHNRKVVDRARRLLEANIATATMQLLLAEYDGNPVFDNSIFENVEIFKHECRKKKIPYDSSTALIYAMLYDIGMDIVPPPVLFAVAKFGTIIRKEGFDKNPYLQTVKVPPVKRNGFGYSLEKNMRLELCNTNTLIYLDNVAIPRLSTFDHSIKYPVFSQSGRIWMSVSPSEISTMEEPIREAEGKVLTLGLGLGYFAFMASEKAEVEEVTVVEKEPDVIGMFRKYLLPQFPHREKIKIIQADAFDFMAGAEDGTYDHCFVDVWADNMDIASYFKAKRACLHLTKTKVTYWVEDGIIIYIIGIISYMILSSLPETKGVIEEMLDFTGDKEALGLIDNLTRHERIASAEDIDRLTDPAYVKNLVEDYVTAQTDKVSRRVRVKEKETE